MSSKSSYSQFLESLLQEGRVSVPGYGPLHASDLAAAENELVAFERSYRLEMPSDPPEFVIAAAQWAGRSFYRACQFALYRDLGQQLLEDEFRGDAGGGLEESPDAHYSVDLVFRFLSQLVPLARAAAEDDPLVERLLASCRRWPLASVGVSGVGKVSIAGFADHDCLMRLYADRIIATADKSRLVDPRACAAVCAAVGMHSELAGNLGSALLEENAADVTGAAP
jgi:hypothetical protein